MTSVIYRRHWRAVTKNSEWCSELAVIQRVIKKKKKHNGRNTNVFDKSMIFPIKCKSNNKSSVPDADIEILTRGGKRIMSETRFPAFRHKPFTLGLRFSALSVYPRVGISRFASETYDRLYLSQFAGTMENSLCPYIRRHFYMCRWISCQ